MSLERLAEYVRGKVTKCNPNNPKANWGARVIKQSGQLDMIDDFAYQSIEILHSLFAKVNPSNPAGQTNLTRASMDIGQYVLEVTESTAEGKTRMIDQVRIGDLFIEGFLTLGLITLERPVTSDSSYVIRATELWMDAIDYDKQTLIGTHLSPITDGCLIKGEVSKRSQKTVWCRAAMNLMQVPWRVNTPVYEALRASKDMFLQDVSLIEDKDLKQRAISKNRDFNTIMKKAEKVLDVDFYQEVEADYRGRLYFREPFLNFQGSDYARGLMVFSEGKDLGETGQWWLAVHTANSYNQSYDIDEIPEWTEADYYSHLKSEGLDSISVDKFTLEDRVRWTNENMETIIQAGDQRHFFPEAEKPVSFLACCLEWEGISRGVSVSHLPIPVDGSNNGWQHLGAMSKDTRTGQLVGLVAQEIQKDFYVTTAKQLLEIDDEKLNAMPMKHIRKGISKRGSMTRAYSAGAGKIGENMWADCKQAGYHEKYEIEEKDCRRWSNELIKAINVVCPGPLQTMEFLQKLAAFEIGTYKKYRNGEPAGTEYFEIRKELSKLWSEEEKDVDRIEELLEEVRQFYSVLVEGNGKKRIQWKTPSNFPVKYEAFRLDDFKCRGTINGKQIKHVLKVPTEIPDIRKYMCGISPNYVHSMDAAHMALVIDRWGGAFGAVHDSFSTHACDVDDLLDIIKDTFIEMYDVEDYFDKITDDILSNTEGFDIPKPQLGSLEIQEIRNSDYFFA